MLHAIKATAADDELVRRNPCRIDGAGDEDSPERDVISLPDVFAIAPTLSASSPAMPGRPSRTRNDLARGWPNASKPRIERSRKSVVYVVERAKMSGSRGGGGI